MIRGLAPAVGALVALGLLLCAAPSRAGLADRVGATFALMAEEFVRAFQPIEGLIVSVEATRSTWTSARAAARSPAKS